MSTSTSPKKNKPSGAPASTSSTRRWILRLACFMAFIATCGFLDSIKHRWYVLDPDSLHELSRAAIAAAPDDMPAIVDYIVANLTATYPSTTFAINQDKSEWVFNNAGGAMGAMYVIHASITEYLIIFGTPVGTEGHSGAHPADDYFYILKGEQWAYEPPSYERLVFPAGSVQLFPRGAARRQYKIHEGAFALEYARGWIPLMLPFGFIDFFTSTLDFVTLYRTIHLSGREIIRNLLIGKI